MLKMLNAPNCVSMSRLALTPVLAALLYWPGTTMRVAAATVYVLACLTDIFDGYLARRSNQDTALGRMLDPVSDKAIVVTVVVLLTADGRIDGILVLPALFIVLREVLISGLREMTASFGLRLEVTVLAKYKTITQMFALGFLIVGDAAPYWLAAETIGAVLLWLAAALTAVSGAGYLRTAAAVVSGGRVASPSRRRRSRPRRRLGVMNPARVEGA